MKLNYFAQRLSTVGRWLTKTLFCVAAIAFIFQCGFFSNTSAMAAPTVNVIAAADVSDNVQDKASEDAGRTKNFIRDTEEKVKQTANKNAARVEQATDGDSNFIERKAKRDRDRIEKRAEEDSARTQEAVDNTKNVVEKAVENIKDVFSN